VDVDRILGQFFLRILWCAAGSGHAHRENNLHTKDVSKQIFRGIDLEVEGGNPGAIALWFEGAQGGVIQDVAVRLAPDALAGFGGGGGAGTSHINVAVHGGVHGVYFNSSDGAAVVASAMLLGQSGSALVSTGGGPLIAVVRQLNCCGPQIIAYR
jgi:hypothetical protein